MIKLDTGAAELAGIQARITEASPLVSHAIDSVRRLVLDLGPAVFEDLGFVPAVRFTSASSRAQQDQGTLKEGICRPKFPRVIRSHCIPAAARRAFQCAQACQSQKREGVSRKYERTPC